MKDRPPELGEYGEKLSGLYGEEGGSEEGSGDGVSFYGRLTPQDQVLASHLGTVYAGNTVSAEAKSGLAQAVRPEIQLAAGEVADQLHTQYNQAVIRVVTDEEGNSVYYRYDEAGNAYNAETGQPVYFE